MKIIKNLSEKYSPLYFLSSLGFGGLSVTFFMYLVFMTEHKEYPIPTFETLSVSLSSANILTNIMTVVALIGIAISSYAHLKLLFWNIKEYRLFKQTDNYNTLKKSDSEVQLMAIPLTFGMTINVAFILGAVFVPKLWSVVEYLFPLALIAFAIAGYFAVKIFADYASRVLTTGEFDNTKNNNLSQMLAVFAFAMIGVGFSASAAMSHIALTSGIAMVLSILFITIAGIFSLIKIVIGFHSMLEHGAEKETSISLWILIPIMTLIGIATFRIIMGLSHNFDMQTSSISHFILFSMIVSIQVIFGYLGYVVMKKLGYFKSFITGDEKSPAAYALICPGVSATVMGFFFLHKGLIPMGIIDQYSLPYFLIIGLLMWIQIKTIRVLFTLNKKMLLISK